MIVFPLQSGSTGNCIYVESASTALLVDAGISGKCAQARLATIGRDIRQCRALLITHDHGDHIRCAGIFARKFKIPVYTTFKTLSAAADRHQIGAIPNLNLFQPGGHWQIDDITVTSLPTPHDAAEGSVFIFDDGKRKVGIFTDLGHVTPIMQDSFRDLDAVYIESNYDEHLLTTGNYPLFLKRRIMGPRGHIANSEASSLIRDYGRRLQWACLGHLSEENNSPDHVLDCHRRMVGKNLAGFVASRYREGPFLEI